MADLNAEYFARLVAGLPENLAEIAKSLSSCLDESIALDQNEIGEWTGELPIAGGDGPGLLVAFRLGNHGVIVAIPEMLPLPAWYTSPGDSESARLQTLAMEWSMNLLPMDVDVDEFATIAVANLRQAIEDAQPAAAAQFVVFDASSETLPMEGQLCLIGPVAIPPVPSLKPAASLASTSVSSAAKTAPAAAGSTVRPATAARPPQPAAGRSHRASPLLGLPVQVVVMLAEKKIELGQLLSLCPGSLIQFDKSCDSLLDLYVNNQLYCRGEAIKIGENFGLKVNEVRPKPTRPKKVL